MFETLISINKPGMVVQALAESVAQIVQHLPSKPKSLSLNPSTDPTHIHTPQKKCQVLVPHACNLSYLGG
jgi:hypothetical protein